MPDSLISIVVPLLNERDIVDESLTRLARIAAELDGHWEVIVVDAGSNDGTRERAEDYCARHAWKFRDGSAAPRSVGGTVSVGVAAAEGARIVVMPSDTMIGIEGFEELREAVTAGARCGGFPKHYVPSSPLLAVYAGIQNIVRFRRLRCRRMPGRRCAASRPAFPPESRSCSRGRRAVAAPGVDRPTRPMATARPRSPFRRG